MGKIWKRFWAMLLIACMVIQNGSTTVFALGNENSNARTVTNQNETLYIEADDSNQWSIVWSDSSDERAVRPTTEMFRNNVSIWTENNNTYEQVQEADYTVSAVSGSNSNWKVTMTVIPETVSGPFYLKVDQTTAICGDGSALKEHYIGKAEKGKLTCVLTYLFSGTLQYLDGAIASADKTTIRPDDLGIKVYDRSSNTEIDASEYTFSAIKGDGDQWSWKVSGLPAYNDDVTTAYSYYLTSGTDKKIASKNADTGYYAVAYDNGTVSSDIDKLYSSGTLKLTLSNDASYTAQINWQDDKAESTKANRPQADISLWRYPSKGSYTWETGAPVKVDGAALTKTLNSLEDTYSVSLETFTTNALPMYDEEGYQYIYFVKENLSGTNSGNYQKIFKLTDGTPSSDAVLYNGKRLDNVRYGTYVVTVTTEWIAQATYYVWENMHMGVLFNRKASGETEFSAVLESDYQVTWGENHSVDYVLPAYDANGLPYEYQMAKGYAENNDGSNRQEVAYQGSGEVVDITIDGETYYSSYECQSADATGATYKITNKLHGTVNLVPVKEWHNGPWTDKPEVVLRISRSSESDPASNYSKIISSSSDSYTEVTGSGTLLSSWIFGTVVEDKYDEKGYRYTYTIAEDTSKFSGVTGFYVKYRYEADATYSNVKLVTENHIGTQGKVITVKKNWLDDGDVNHRGNVVVHLAAKKTDGDWEDLTGYTGTLSVANQWETEIGYVPAELIAAGYDLSTLTAFEYSITDGSGEHVVSYAGSNGNPYAGAGVVVCKEHQYQVSSAEAKTTVTIDVESISLTTAVTISNLRTGIVDIPVKKVWLDGENQDGNRPDSVTVTLLENGTETGTSFVLNRGNSWANTFSNLPKYNDLGALYEYSIRENYTNPGDYSTVIGVDTDNTKKVEPQYATLGADIQAYTITNKRVGTLNSVSVNIIWRDEALRASRPDVYMTLYKKSTKAGSGYENCGYLEPNWSTGNGNAALYHDICTYYLLDKYDSEGYKYEYYFAENINGGAYEEEYYTNAFSMAIDAATAWGVNGHYTAVTGTKNGDNYAKADSYIINRISAELEPSGRKIWSNVEKGATTKEELPAVTLSLFRESAYDTTNKKPAEGVSGTPIDTTASNAWNYNGTTATFSFAGAATLYKYDEYGASYSYSIVEEFTGATEEQKLILKNLYDTKLDEENMILTNAFLDGAKNWRTITVSKTWENIVTGLAGVPATQFTVYRFGTQASANEFVTTLNGDVAKVAATEASSRGGKAAGNIIVKATRTVEDATVTGSGSASELLCYSPKGEPYFYVVVENVEKGPGYNPSHRAVAVPNTKITGLSEDVNARTETVTVTNAYATDAVSSIEGTVKWENNTIIASQPDKANVKLTLYRKAASQSLSGVSNGVAETALTNVDITITGDAETWSYKIKPKNVGGDILYQYAPNGMPYEYIVKIEASEDNKASVNANYNKGKTISASVKGDAVADEKLTIPVLTNTLSGAVQVKVAWDDEDNIYGLRPEKVAIQLQYRAGETAWQDYDGTVEVLETGNWITAKAEKLPVQTADGTKYEYRAVETKIGETTVTYTGESGSALSYTVEKAEAVAADVTGTVRTINITNELTSAASLTIVKKWEDDADNAYGTRKEVSMLVQRSKNGSDWENVTQISGANAGKPLTVILDVTNVKVGEPDCWQIVCDKLPAMDSDGASYQYRAVELLPAATDSNLVMANPESLIDARYYFDGYKVTYSYQNNVASKTYQTTITNTLDSRENLKVSLIWDDEKNQDGDRPTEVTAQLYRNDETKPLLEHTFQNDAWADWEISGLPEWKQHATTAVRNQYYVKLKDVSGYTVTFAITVNDTTGAYASTSPKTSADENVSTTFNIKNSYTPKTVDVKLEKTWSDDTDSTARPAQVGYYIKAIYTSEGVEITKYVKMIGDVVSFVDVKTAATRFDLTSGNGWESTLSDFPRNINPQGTDKKNGTSVAITYQAEENTTAPYTPSYEGNLNVDTWDLSITNTLQTVDYEVERTWEGDKNNKYATRSESTVKLQRKISTEDWQDVSGKTHTFAEEHLADASDNFTFSGLAKADADGNVYTYRVVPMGDILGYQLRESHDWGARKSTLVYTLETVDLEGCVVFYDDSNKYNTRPNSITLEVRDINGNLLEETSDVTVEDVAMWSYNITGLPKYEPKTNTLATYRVVEQTTGLEIYTISPSGGVVVQASAGTNVVSVDDIRNQISMIGKVDINVEELTENEIPVDAGSSKDIAVKTEIEFAETVVASETNTMKSGEEKRFENLPIGSMATITMDVDTDYVQEVYINGVLTKYQVLDGKIIVSFEVLYDNTYDVVEVDIKNRKTYSKLTIENTTALGSSHIGGTVMVVSDLVENDTFQYDGDVKSEQFGVMWKPDENWAVGDAIAIRYRKPDGTETSIAISNYLKYTAKGEIEGILEPEQWDIIIDDVQKDAEELENRFMADFWLGSLNDFVLELDGEPVKMLWNIPSMVNYGMLPTELSVQVNFVPTLVVKNTTEGNEPGGQVRVEEGRWQVKADGGTDDPESYERYVLSTIAHGEANDGWYVDADRLYIGLPDSFTAIDLPQEYASADNRLLAAANARNNSAGDYKKIIVDDTGAFSTVLTYTNGDGTRQDVDVRGYVRVTEQDADGNATKITVAVERLEIPLDLGIPFVKIASASNPTPPGGGTSSDINMPVQQQDPTDSQGNKGGNATTNDSSQQNNAAIEKSEAEKKKSSVQSAETGDYNALYAAFVLLGAGVLCICAALLQKRRKKH